MKYFRLEGNQLETPQYIEKSVEQTQPENVQLKLNLKTDPPIQKTEIGEKIGKSFDKYQLKKAMLNSKILGSREKKPFSGKATRGQLSLLESRNKKNVKGPRVSNIESKFVEAKKKDTYKKAAPEKTVADKAWKKASLLFRDPRIEMRKGPDKKNILVPKNNFQNITRQWGDVASY